MHNTRLCSLEILPQVLEPCFRDWNLCRNCLRVLLQCKSWLSGSRVEPNLLQVYQAPRLVLMLLVPAPYLKKAPSFYHFPLSPRSSPNLVSFTRRLVFVYCGSRKTVDTHDFLKEDLHFNHFLQFIFSMLSLPFLCLWGSVTYNFKQL